LFGYGRGDFTLWLDVLNKSLPKNLSLPTTTISNLSPKTTHHQILLGIFDKYVYIYDDMGSSQIGDYPVYSNEVLKSIARIFFAFVASKKVQNLLQLIFTVFIFFGIVCIIPFASSENNKYTNNYKEELNEQIQPN
jgi:cbb3-type cytochrome oxidase subunit 3